MNKYLKIFIVISLLIVATAILYSIVLMQYFGEWSSSAPFGDSFGALGAVFSALAFAGVIITILVQKKGLEHQRKQLKLQQKEVENSRIELQVNRITDIIYRQIERFEKAIGEFDIIESNQAYTAENAFIHLNAIKQVFNKTDYTQKTEKEMLLKEQEANCNGVKVYSQNKDAIESFAVKAWNATNVVKETLSKAKLASTEIKTLKELYFRSLGSIYLEVIEDITQKVSAYLTLFIEDETANCPGIDHKNLERAATYLTAILDFRDKSIAAKDTGLRL